MKTKTGFVVDSSDKGSKTGDFVWFVRHEKINDGETKVVPRGYLEYYLTKNRKKIM